MTRSRSSWRDARAGERVDGYRRGPSCRWKWPWKGDSGDRRPAAGEGRAASPPPHESPEDRNRCKRRIAARGSRGRSVSTESRATPSSRRPERPRCVADRTKPFGATQQLGQMPVTCWPWNQNSPTARAAGAAAPLTCRIHELYAGIVHVDCSRIQAREHSAQCGYRRRRGGRECERRANGCVRCRRGTQSVTKTIPPAAVGFEGVGQLLETRCRPIGDQNRCALLMRGFEGYRQVVRRLADPADGIELPRDLQQVGTARHVRQG